MMGNTTWKIVSYHKGNFSLKPCHSFCLDSSHCIYRMMDVCVSYSFCFPLEVAVIATLLFHSCYVSHPLSVAVQLFSSYTISELHWGLTDFLCVIQTPYHLMHSWKRVYILWIDGLSFTERQCFLCLAWSRLGKHCGRRPQLKIPAIWTESWW